MKAIILFIALLIAAPALARDRTVTVTSFDRVRIEGNFQVEITTGRGASARITGTEAAIERTSVTVQGQTLVVRANRSGWGGMPGRDNGPALIRLTTPFLRTLAVAGASIVKVDAMRASSVSIALEGSGVVTIAGIDTDALDVGSAGAGSIIASGRAAAARTVIRGTATLDAAALTVRDAKVISESAGTLTLTAIKTANVIATGSGTVTILGTPACTLVNKGSGTISCGRAANR
jgi:hypothetical protein